MAVSSVTIDLSENMFPSYYYDDDRLVNTLTVPSSEVAALSFFLLKGMSEDNKKNIPLNLKENIIKECGLKHVFRLPDLMRAVTITAAATVALATRDPKQCLAAAGLTIGALATNQVSQTTATLVSDILEGTLSITNRSATALLSGAKSVAKFCYTYPKSVTVATLALGVGLNRTEIAEAAVRFASKFTK